MSNASGDLRVDNGGKFIYVGDVMCSWCWGFAATLDQIAERFDLPIRVVNGGLRPGAYSKVLDDEMAGYLSHHWDQAAEASGQPFDTAFLQRRDGWRFDSEMPATAVVAMRNHRREFAFPFFKDIQHAFFAEGIDVTDPDRYGTLVSAYPVDPAQFVDYLVSEQARQAAWKDFELARSLGISSFPALLLYVDGKTSLVTRGWLPFEQLVESLTALLTESGYEVTENPACAVDR